MPKVTIDGVEIEVAAGTTVLQAALSQGREVPHYCYHPGLTVAGNCRMCLVEIEKAPKLAIGCATPVADGMVVHTQSAKVKAAQSSVMEFLLVNHPLDCTICDQAGECRLQEYAVEYGSGVSRNSDAKVLFNKAVDIGKHVMLDQERCIQCSRCTRFCAEVTGTGELDFFQRGEHTMIGVYPDRPLNNPYSGNVVDICPVGALTLKEFRFQTRVWYLKNTPTICAGCSRGCNIIVAVGTQQEMMTTRGQFDDRIKRVVPRFNEAVNGHWMCDEGRLSYKRQQAGDPLMSAESPSGSPLEWDDAVARAAHSLKAAAAAGRAAAIFSPRMVSESYFAWKRLFDALGGVRAAVQRLISGEDDKLLIRADKGANSFAATAIFGSESADALIAAAARGEIDTLLVFGDPLDPQDTVELGEIAATQVIHIGPFRDASARVATLSLPACAWAEEDGSYFNFDGRAQWTRRCHRPRGEGRPGWRIVTDLAAAAGVELPHWQSAEEVFDVMTQSVDSFGGVKAKQLGLLGISPASTANA